MVCIGASAAFAAGPASASKASRSAKASGKLDLAYFAGKTIDFISPGAPGGSYDDLARILAPQIAAFLHCSVEVTDLSTGGGITGQNSASAAPPNGLAIGELNSAGDIENFVEGSSRLTFSFKKQVYLGGIPEVNIVWMANTKSAYRNIKQIIHPSGPLRVLDVSSGYQDLLDRALLGAYGIPSSSFITGFSGSPAMLQGFYSDDGPIVNIGLQAGYAAIANGIARPLLLTLPMERGALGYATMHQLKLPSYQTILTKYPPKTAQGRRALRELVDITTGAGQVVFAPVGTPKRIAAALRAAVKHALSLRSVKDEEDTEGLQPGYFSPQQVASNFNKMLKGSSSLAPFLPHLG